MDGNTHAINRYLAQCEVYEERQEALEVVKKLADAEERIEELELAIRTAYRLGLQDAKAECQKEYKDWSDIDWIETPEDIVEKVTGRQDDD